MAPLAPDLMTMSSIDDSNTSKSTTKKKSSKSMRHLAVSPGAKTKKKLKVPVSSPNSSPVAAPKKPKSMLIPSKAMLEGAVTVKHRSKKIAMSSRNLGADDDTVPTVSSKSTTVHDGEKSTKKAHKSSRKLLDIDEEPETTTKKSSDKKKIRKSSRKLLGDDDVDLEPTHTSSSKTAKIKKSSRKLLGDDDADHEAVPSSTSKSKKSGKSSRKLLGDEDLDDGLKKAASKTKKIRKSSRKLLGDEDLEHETDPAEFSSKKIKKSSRKLLGDDFMDPETAPDATSKSKKIRKSSRKLLGDDDIDPEVAPSAESKSKKIRKSTRKLLGDDIGDLEADKKTSSKSSKIKKSSRKLLGDDDGDAGSAVKVPPKSSKMKKSSRKLLGGDDVEGDTENVVSSKSSKIKKSSRKLLGDDDESQSISVSGASKTTKVRKSSRKLLGDEVPDQEPVPTSASKVKKSKMKASSRKLDIDGGTDEHVPEEKSSKKKSSKLKSMRKLVAESKATVDDMVPLQPPPQVPMEPVVNVAQDTEKAPPDDHRVELTGIGKKSSVPSQYTYDDFDDFDDFDDDLGDGDSVVDPNPSFFEPTLARTVSMRDLMVSPPSSPQPKRRGKKTSPSAKQPTQKTEAGSEHQPDETKQHTNPASPASEIQVVNDDTDEVEIRRKLKASSSNLVTGEVEGGHSCHQRGRSVERNGGTKKSSKNLMEKFKSANDDIACGEDGSSRGRTKSVERKKIKKSSRHLVDDVEEDKHSDHRSRRRSKSADRHGSKIKKSSRHLHTHDDEPSGSGSNTQACKSNVEDNEEVPILRRKLKSSSHGREKSVERRASKSSKSSRPEGAVDSNATPTSSVNNVTVMEKETTEMQDDIPEKSGEESFVEQLPQHLEHRDETSLEERNNESNCSVVPNSPTEQERLIVHEEKQEVKAKATFGADDVHVSEESMEHESSMDESIPQPAERSVEAASDESNFEKEDGCIPEVPLEHESLTSEVSPENAEVKEESESNATSVEKEDNCAKEASVQNEATEIQQVSQDDGPPEVSESNENGGDVNGASASATYHKHDATPPVRDDDEDAEGDSSLGDEVPATETDSRSDAEELPENEVKLDVESGIHFATARETDNSTFAEASMEDRSENNSAIDFFFSPSSSSQGRHDSQLWKALGLNTPFSPGLMEPVTPTPDQPEVKESIDSVENLQTSRGKDESSTSNKKVKPIPDLNKESGHDTKGDVIVVASSSENEQHMNAMDNKKAEGLINSEVVSELNQRESVNNVCDVDSVESTSIGEISDIDLEEELSLGEDEAPPNGGKESQNHRVGGNVAVVGEQEDEDKVKGDQNCEGNTECESDTLDLDEKDKADVASEVKVGTGAYMKGEMSGTGDMDEPLVRALHAESSEIQGDYYEEDAENAMHDDGRRHEIVSESQQEDNTSEPNAGSKLEEGTPPLASEASTASETETPSSNTMSEKEVGSEKPKGLSSLKGSGKLDLFRNKVSQVILFRRMFGGKNYDELSEGEKRADKGSYQRSCLSKKSGEDNSRISGEGWKVNFSSELVMIFEIEDLTKRNTSWGDVWDDLYFDEETLAEFKYQAFLEECGLAEAE